MTDPAHISCGATSTIVLPGDRRYLIHDERLRGTAPNIASRIDVVGPTVPIRSAFRSVANYVAAHGRLSHLILMCHGYERLISDGERAVSAMVGGFGLQLCADDLTNHTIFLASILKDLTEIIVVYACAAADTHPLFRNHNGDGFRLMGEFAAFANAQVVAAEQTQWYTREPVSPGTLESSQEINFGLWEGRIFRFRPDGSAEEEPPLPMNGPDLVLPICR